jgi:hypothetical protein
MNMMMMMMMMMKYHIIEIHEQGLSSVPVQKLQTFFYRVCLEDVELSRWLLFAVRLVTTLRNTLFMTVKRDVRAAQNKESISSLCLVAYPVCFGAQRDSPARCFDSTARYRGPLVGNHCII